MGKKVDITKLLTRAKDALDRRNYDLAIVNYEQALTFQPENLDARIKLRATQTRAVNENGRSGIPRAVMAYLKAKVMALLGKGDQAVIACEPVLKAFPSTPFFLKEFASFADKAGLTEVAAWQRQEVVDKYNAEDVGNLYELAGLYEQLGRGQEAVDCYERIRKINPDEDVDSLIRNASALMSSSHFAEAAEKGARSMLKDEEEAEFLEIDTNKLRSDPQRLKVIHYLQEHDVKERPDDYRTYARIADIYSDLEDFKTGYAEAKKHYEQAIGMNASDSSLRDRLGDLEMKALRFQLKNVQDKYKAAPEDAELKKKYRDLYEKYQAYQVQEYERRVKEQPLKAEFHFRLGELYFKRKRYEEAVGELQQAAKDPKYRLQTLTTLGRCFINTEQIEMAITQFQRAREGQEIFQRIREPLYYEAMAHEQLGTAESLRKALDLYTKIYEDDIGFQDVRTKVPEVQKRLKELEAAE